MVYERTLDDVRNVVFDLDGTVWEWNRLKSGVQETIDDLRDHGKDVYFVTNSALLTRDGYAEKLRDLGLAVDAEQVLPASYIAAEVLDDAGVRDVYVIGEDGLRQELNRHDITHTEDASHVLVAVDRNLTYWKVATAAEILRDAGTCWATAADAYWWGGDRYLPGTRALVNSITTAADADEVAVVGKPSDHAMQVLRDEWSLLPDKTVMIGDSMGTDAVFGNKLGWMTALVLGGVSSEDEIRQADGLEAPDMVFRSFRRITMKL